MYLKIGPHKQQSMPTRINSKLVARYYGPFKVIAQIGLVAYRLQLREGAQIGDEVYLKIGPHKQQSMPTRIS